MILSGSILGRATCAELFLIHHGNPGCHLFHWTRQVHVESAPATLIELKSRPKRCKKKLQDLPLVFTLPDGTPAKPLGDWRTGSLIKDPKHARTPVDAQGNIDDDKDALMSVPPALEPTSATTEPVKPRRTRKKISQTDATGATAPVEISRPKRRRQSDSEPFTKPRTILAQEIQENLRKFPHCLLLTRVGQFYESYFEQAEEIARLLGIKLTSRKWGGSRVAMCGFPLIHLDKHLKVLVQQYKRFVAMCEEFPRKEEFGAREFERRVTRIITPGTLIDEPFLNAYENNFLLAISTPSPEQQIKDETVGLAWTDVSTGEFYSKSVASENVQDELARINPREVVLPTAFQNTREHPILDALAEENCFLSFLSEPPVSLDCQPTNLPDLESGSFQASLTLSEQAAVALLTSYLNANLLENMPPLTDPIQDNTGRMQIDAHTIKALEIRESTYEGGTRGCLLNVIKRTVTSGGTRLLSRWLCSPSTSLPEIAARQSLVEFFIQRPHLSADLIHLLAKIDDTSRLIQKFLVGRGTPNDLMAISRIIHIWSKILAALTTEQRVEAEEQKNYNSMEWTSINALTSRIHELTELSQTIDSALGVEDGEQTVNSDQFPYEAEGPEDPNESIQSLNLKLPNNKWFIKPEFSKKLQALHDRFQELITEKDVMENNLRSQYGAPSLTLRVSPGQGTHVHLARKCDQRKLKADPNFVPTYESGSTKCFFYKDWSHLGNQIMESVDRLSQAEKEAFHSLQSMINEFAFSLRRNSDISDELDVALSFAKVAKELGFVKPTMTNEGVYNIIHGRHPSVEIGLLTSGRVFTPNSVQLNPDGRVHIITGPNMAGKSTLLRQTALISVLAQIGSFVPAEAATIGVVDKLFSRIGAKDDLFRDRSTFMVEMLETADILRRATDKSLVIMDEVGRGTTVNDGLAIAFATVHHLTTVNRCRTLFATHFHELAHMLGHTSAATGSGIYQNVRFYCTDIDETEDGYFAYSYKMRPGVNWDSHGLKVAQLAGLPEPVIEVAADTLSRLKQKGQLRDLAAESDNISNLW